MPDPLFDVGAESLARMALKNAREAHVNVDVAPRAKRAAGVAPRPIPWSRDLMRKVRTPSRTMGISATAAWPFLSDISRQLRQTIFELLRSDLTFLEGGDGRLRGDVFVKAHLSARLLARGRKDFFSDPEAMLVCDPGELGAVPPSWLHLVSDPNTQGDMLPDSRDACPCILSAPRQVGDHQTAPECAPFP